MSSWQELSSELKEPQIRSGEGSPRGLGPFGSDIARIAESLPHAEPALSSAAVLEANDQADVLALPEWETEHIVNLERLNNVRYINKFLEAVNEKLPKGGCFIGYAESARQRRKRILAKFPNWFARPYYVTDFILKRVLPKLWLTKRLYFFLTKGRNRVISKAEILGRIVACGFEIVQQCDVENRMYFVVRKTGPPAYDLSPSYGPIFRMKRIGQGGRVIYVYKLRTMHPYAEYLQEYVYESNKLSTNGKIRNDYRITSWGKVMRRCFIDELPMLINLLKGEMKLVGVRPISAHYLSLYPANVAERRTTYKPGLVPPYYVDLPQSLDEVIASESKYLDAYDRRPLVTDIQYFFAAMYNIVVKRKRSQ